MKQDKLPYIMRAKIKRSRARVFVPGDFANLSGYDQVLRVLRNMTRSGELIKIGQGIYAKTKTFSDGKVSPAGFIGDLARQALEKLGIKTANSTYCNAYNAEVSTQVPNGLVIAVDRRVRRKIGNVGYSVKYEQMNKRYKSLWYNKPNVAEVRT